MSYSQESLDRIAKIESLKRAGVVVYANHYHAKQDISDILKNTQNIRSIEEISESPKNSYRIAGRLVGYKSHGKLAFGKLIDHSWTIQIAFMKGKFQFFTGKNLVDTLELDGSEKDAYKIIEKYTYIGDYLGVHWELFLTKHGEITLFVTQAQILSKAIRPLPEKFHGLTDQETIYRQRYLDMIANEDSYERFRFRSRFIQTLRNFYTKHDFFEVETPVLGNAASGAAAAPFITHHNDFDEDFYLRISPETFLKRITVGRFERVVEFAKDFRNEGSDPSHMQEFSAIEHYAAWWNFEDNMRFTEEMFDYIFDQLQLERKIIVKDKQWVSKEVDFSTPWERIDYISGVQKACGIDVSQYTIGDEEKLKADIKDAGISFEWMDQMMVPTLIDYLYKKVLRPWIVGPAFVYNYPKTMQPLARQNDENPNIVEQFQLVVNGWEIIKAYSELVDPIIQKENFDAQAQAKDMGDEEATSGDDDFVHAMEYAMPPQSGWGMGIERVLALLTGQENLRDVVLFPLVKSIKNHQKE